MVKKLTHKKMKNEQKINKLYDTIIKAETEQSKFYGASNRKLVYQMFLLHHRDFQVKRRDTLQKELTELKLNKELSSKRKRILEAFNKL